VYLVSHDLNFSNRPVRTRMPGGVGGARSGILTAPIPIFLALQYAIGYAIGYAMKSCFYLATVVRHWLIAHVSRC
jgi:hypothetical protein